MGEDDAVAYAQTAIKRVLVELLTSVGRTAYRFARSDRAYVVPSPTHLAS
jgi:hypothetical protein